jgi:hypothetical protein
LIPIENETAKLQITQLSTQEKVAITVALQLRVLRTVPLVRVATQGKLRLLEIIITGQLQVPDLITPSIRVRMMKPTTT